jgi:flagellar hook assembly protein FlgD
LPKTFSLSQNYPNPFNPSTTIDYSIPEGDVAQVSLKIFDLRGRLVRKLVEREQHPGQYSVQWDGRNGLQEVVGSGVYLYRIETADFTSTKKMIIAR